MGPEPGDEKLHPDRQHLPLFWALQDRLLQGLQWQAVPAGGRSANHLLPSTGDFKDWTPQKGSDAKRNKRNKSDGDASRKRASERGNHAQRKTRNEGRTGRPWRKTAVWQAKRGSQKQSVRQQGATAVQRERHVRLPGRGLHGMLLPLPRVRLQEVRGGVPLRPEVALRAGGSGRRRNHPEQICDLTLVPFLYWFKKKSYQHPLISSENQAFDTFYSVMLCIKKTM